MVSSKKELTCLYVDFFPLSFLPKSVRFRSAQPGTFGSIRVLGREEDREGFGRFQRTELLVAHRTSL